MALRKHAKTHLLKLAPKIIKRQEKLAKDEEHVSSAQKQMFDTISKLIIQEEDYVKFEFREGDINVKVMDVMNAVASGQLKPSEGQKMLEMVRTSFEMVELENLMEQMESAGLLENKR